MVKKITENGLDPFSYRNFGSIPLCDDKAVQFLKVNWLGTMIRCPVPVIGRIINGIYPNMDPAISPSICLSPSPSIGPSKCSALRLAAA